MLNNQCASQTHTHTQHETNVKLETTCGAPDALSYVTVGTVRTSAVFYVTAAVHTRAPKAWHQSPASQRRTKNTKMEIDIKAPPPTDATGRSPAHMATDVADDAASTRHTPTQHTRNPKQTSSTIKAPPPTDATGRSPANMATDVADDAASTRHTPTQHTRNPEQTSSTYLAHASRTPWRCMFSRVTVCKLYNNHDRQNNQQIRDTPRPTSHSSSLHPQSTVASSCPVQKK